MKYLLCISLMACSGAQTATRASISAGYQFEIMKCYETANAFKTEADRLASFRPCADAVDARFGVGAK